MLNEAYKVLMKEDLRRQYDASIGQMRVRNGTTTYSGLAYSAWKGPLRPQALFVDENACIGHFPTQNSAIYLFIYLFYHNYPIKNFFLHFSSP